MQAAADGAEHGTPATGEQGTLMRASADPGSDGGGGKRLHWGWVLVPAVITHGTYDSVLFVLATLVPGAPGATEEQVPVSQMDFWQVLEQLVLLPVGWVYLAVPLFWMRKKLAKADLPALHARSVTSGASATEMDAHMQGHQMLEVPGLQEGAGTPGQENSVGI